MLSSLHALPAQSRQILIAHVKRSADGMITVVSRAGADRVIRLGSIDELREYCYIVAGIVGEMLTELFLLGRPHLASAASYLRARSRAVRRRAAAGQHSQGRGRGRPRRGGSYIPAGRRRRR